MKAVAKSPSTSQSKVVQILNQSLASMVTLKLHAKQVHWNIKGEDFLSIHELFDKVATQADDYADLLAERAVQLEGFARGDIGDIHKNQGLGSLPANLTAQEACLKAISADLAAMAEDTREAIDATAALGDAVTADLYTGITAGLDKLHWFVRSHLR
jgi:starvation-inducible DNA-binding protein